MQQFFTKKNVFLISSLIVILSAFFISLIEYKDEYALISMFFMIFLSFPTYYFFIKKHNKLNAIKIIVFLSLLSMVIETIGILTGFPYGYFNYTNKLGPKIFVIPITLSFGFVPLVIASWYLVDNLKLKNILNKIIIGTLLLVIFDLVIDPGAVALNFWEWDVKGFYYGIPFSNFLGWIFTSFISMSIIFYLMKEKANSIYLIYTAFIGNLFWLTVVIINKMIIPSIIGLILMVYMIIKIKEKN